eukprot:jgi/Orpsp1_1/1185282/evm.model.c7180000093072.1
MSGRKQKDKEVTQNNSVAHPENTPKGITFNYSENFNRIVELSIDNYDEWKTNMLYLLCINNLDEYITHQKLKKIRKRDLNEDINVYIQDKFDDSMVFDKSTDPQDIKNDILVKWIIMNSLGPETRKTIKSNNKTAFQIWTILRKAFTKSPEQRIQDLKDKIENIKYNIEEDIHIFIAMLQNLIDELENLNGDIPSSTKAGILNRSLPEELRFINIFQFKDNWDNCCDYVKRVIPDIIFSNKKETLQKPINQAYNLETMNIGKINQHHKKSIKSIPKCKICHKKGHLTANCWFNKNNKRNKYNKYNKHNNHKHFQKRRSKYNHYTTKRITKNKRIFTSPKQVHHLNRKNSDENLYADIFTKDYQSTNDYELNYIGIDENEINYNVQEVSSCWILDSGASIHTTYQLDLLSNVKECNESITLANGEKITSTHIGDLNGHINNNKIILKNVYYTPLIKRNLISISSLTMENYKIVFNNNNNSSYAIIYDNNGNRIQSIKSDTSNTYKIYILKYNKLNNDNKMNININHLSTDNLQLWHRRMCHFNIEKIKNKLPNTNLNNKCEICTHSKFKNKPFYPSKNKTKSTFDIIHMDLIGPIPNSIYNNKYILTILDDYSRYGWVIPLKSKSDTFNCFYNWFLQIKNNYNKTIKNIRTDNGTEFVNYHFKFLCKKYGINHQLIVPHNPQQNGMIERFNGTLISAAKSLLNDSKLSFSFWEDAINTANYIYNRLPHSGIENRIPFEVLLNANVNYDNIKVFGCKVFFYVPKQNRKKFENNSLPGIFLGYTENPYTYKIYDITNKKSITSRAVEFYENEPGNFPLTNPSNYYNNN